MLYDSVTSQKRIIFKFTTRITSNFTVHYPEDGSIVFSMFLLTAQAGVAVKL
jgi:hypothetical protein